MNVERYARASYPMIPDNPLLMSIQAALERPTISSSQRSAIMRPGVRAATLLGRDSATEVIDVNRLSQRNTSTIRYVQVADSKGRIYCVDGLVSSSCWLKIVSLAKDCQSCNVLLASTENGVVLKAIRCITPGEPLLMWFTENILAMMNMPFLTPSNIQGQNRYICHICNNLFEYPNPLKVHLALKCNRLDSNHLWSILANEFIATPKATLSLNLLFPQKIGPFKFELTGSSPQTSPSRRISPILVETLVDSATSLIRNNSPNSSNQPSPTSSNVPSPSTSNQASPISSAQVSPSSSTQVSPVRKNLGHRGISAFKPYINKPSFLPTTSNNTVVDNNNRINDETIMARNANNHHSHDHRQRVLPPPASVPMRNDAHAAQMETIVSNLGKSKQGHLCIYCGKVYSRKYGLKIHIRTHTGYKPLKCKYCMRPFGDPSNLNKHVRLHADGETPYRCELCGKVLVRRRDLERHIRSRHQDSAAADRVSDASSDGTDVQFD